MAGAARDTPAGEQEVGGCEGAGRPSGGLGSPADTARGESGSRHAGVSLPSRALGGWGSRDSLSPPGFVRGFVRGLSEYLE